MKAGQDLDQTLVLLVEWDNEGTPKVGKLTKQGRRWSGIGPVKSWRLQTDRSIPRLQGLIDGFLLVGHHRLHLILSQCLDGTLVWSSCAVLQSRLARVMGSLWP